MRSLFKKITGICLLTVISVCMIIPSAGCSTKNAKNKYKLFYKNASSNKLVTVDYSTQTQELDELVLELLNKMNQKVKNKKLKPEEVNIEKCDIKNNTVNIYFNNGYNDMSEYDELFYRAGVVKMLTQIHDISYVQFYVGDSQAKYKDGSYIGLMTKDSFVDDTNESLGNIEWRKVDLYYSNKMGDKLVKKVESVAYSKNTSLERIIVEQLIKGPGDSTMNSTLPSDLKLLSISVSDGICYVNLSSSFLTEMVNVTSEIPVYSIVNSLCSLGNISGVKIMINGDSAKSYRESISLENVLKFNSEVISS
jgi:germination protein M